MDAERNFLKEPIIIIGFGRSGTSILADAIMQHSDLAYISNYNAKFVGSSAVNLVRHIFDNRMWRILGQKPQLNAVSILNRYAFKPSESYEYLNSITGRDFGRGFLLGVKEGCKKRDEIRIKLSKLVMLQGKNRFAFKITGPSRLGYLNSVFPDARYIFVKRKPLPNIRSLLNVGFYQDRKHGLWWHGEGVYNAAEMEFVEKNKGAPELIAALQYFKVQQTHSMEADKYAMSDRILTINYEDFVSRPEETLSKVLCFAKLKDDKYVNSFIARNRIHDRDKKGVFYFSEDLDAEVEYRANFGV